MSCKCIYVAATSQHVGKTTSTLGLIAALQRAGIQVGYCKPLGQEFIDVGPSRVDKDALLFSDFMGFELEPHKQDHENWIALVLCTSMQK